jgi:hypothetical protein
MMKSYVGAYLVAGNITPTIMNALSPTGHILRLRAKQSQILSSWGRMLQNTVRLSAARVRGKAPAPGPSGERLKRERRLRLAQAMLQE